MTASCSGIADRCARPIGDGLTFNAWLAAHALNDPAAVEVAVRRFRPEFRVAFDAWLATNPDTNPDAPPGPQTMPQYQQPDAVKARQLNAKGFSIVQLVTLPKPPW